MFSVTFAGRPVLQGAMILKDWTVEPPFIYFPSGFDPTTGQPVPLTYIVYDEDDRIMHGMWTGQNTPQGQARINWWPMNPPPGQPHRYTVYVFAEPPNAYPQGFDYNAYRYVDNLYGIVQRHGLAAPEGGQLTYFSQ